MVGTYCFRQIDDNLLATVQVYYVDMFMYLYKYILKKIFIIYLNIR